MQSPLDRAAHVLQLRVEHFFLSRGLESVRRSFNFRPGCSTIFTGSPLCLTASLNLRLVASLKNGSLRTVSFGRLLRGRGVLFCFLLFFSLIAVSTLSVKPFFSSCSE